MGLCIGSTIAYGESPEEDAISRYLNQTRDQRPQTSDLNREIKDQERPSSSPTAKPARGSFWEISGHNKTSYRVRFTEHEGDHDIWNDTLFNLGKEREDRVNASFFFRTRADLDGGQHTSGYDPFDSLEDSRKGAVSGELFHAYVDFNRFSPFEQIRFGRQFHEGADYLRFDGFTAETEEFAIATHPHLILYGGIPVSSYEGSRQNDYLVGWGTRLSPSSTLRLSADHLHIQDERHYGYLGEMEDDRSYDDLFLVKGTKLISDDWDLSTRLTSYTKEFRDFEVGSGWNGKNDQVRLSFLAQPAEVRNHVMAADELTYAAGTAKPYYEARLDGSTRVSRHFTLEPGIAVRELVHEYEEGTFNHEYRQLFVSGIIEELVARDSQLTITPEMWEGEEDVLALQLDYNQKLTRSLRGGVGTDFSRYRYDWDYERERENVAGGYTKLTWRISRTFEGKLSYRVEDDEFETYHTIQASLNYKF